MINNNGYIQKNKKQSNKISIFKIKFNKSNFKQNKNFMKKLNYQKKKFNILNKKIKNMN